MADFNSAAHHLNFSVLVIAATLSTVDAVGSSKRALRVTGATGTLWLAKDSWPVGQILLKGNFLLFGLKAIPTVDQRHLPARKMGKEKGRDTTNLADFTSALFVVPRPGGGLLWTPKRLG